MDQQTEKYIKKEINNRPVGWVFCKWLQNLEDKIRAKAIDYMVEEVCLGTLSWPSKIFCKLTAWVWRDEINYLKEKKEHITKQAINSLLDKLAIWVQKREKNKKQ